MRLIIPASRNLPRVNETPGHNLGAYNLGGHPAGMPWDGSRMPRHNLGRHQPRAGGHRGHNVGQNSGAMGGSAFPGVPGQGFGVNYDQCGPTPAPNIPTGPDGCPVGWNQCKQDLAIDSGATVVPAGGTITFPVTPRRVFTPYYFIYPGALATFTIDKIEVDGVNYLGSDVPILAETYQPIVEDLTVQWGQFSSTTPLFVTLTNISAGDARFRGTLKGIASRG